MKDLFEVAAKKSKRQVPYSFVLELLEKADPITKPMFGCLAIYIESKIVLILRDKPNELEDNGIWVATTEEYHAALRKEFPSLRSIRMFGEKSSGWQNLPSEAEDFEEAASRICELILNDDPRVGKIPKPRAKSKSKSKPKALSASDRKRVQAAPAGKRHEVSRKLRSSRRKASNKRSS